jgi:Ohr subfamily peroxiredoxin
MTKAIYTAEARVTGGRLNGRGRTSDGMLDVTLRPPKELGGDGAGTNPEQLLAVAWGACFEASMGLAARRRGLSLEEVADATVDSRVMLLRGDPELKLAAALDVTLPSIDDPATAAALVRDTHEICPFSDATRGNIEVSFSVNGAPVEAVAVA